MSCQKGLYKIGRSGLNGINYLQLGPYGFHVLQHLYCELDGPVWLKMCGPTSTIENTNNMKIVKNVS